MKRFRSAAVLLVFLPAVLPVITNCAKSTPPSKTADQVVEETAQGLASHRPQVLWNALPASYQKDAEALVHELARKMDKTLWNKAFDLAEKGIRVLKTKKDLLLKANIVKNSHAGFDRLSGNWDALIDTAEVIVQSELGDLETLKHLDVGRFLSGTGAEFMKTLDALSYLDKKNDTTTTSQQLKSMSATVLQSGKDTARLKIQMPGRLSWEMPFVKVEGKWIPKPLADQWDFEISRARKALDAFSTNLTAGEKQQFLGMMTSIDGILDQMLAARNPQEMESALAQGFGLLLGMALGKG